MLLFAVAALAVLLVRPLGGRLGALSEVRLRSSGLVAAALAAQVLALVVLADGWRPLLVALHAGSYVLAGAFVWRNRALPGIGLLAVGALLNSLVLAVNGGTMPADPDAVRRAGLAVVQEGYTNSGVLAHPHLAALGDVLASPAWLPSRNVYSLGDLLVLTGVVWCVHRTCGTVLARRAQRGAPARATSQPGTASAAIGRLSR